MSRKLLLLMLLALLIGTLNLASRVEKAKGSGTIYIRADGSVEGTTHIQTVDNVTYFFTADTNGYMEIQRDNIILDGHGYTLQGFAGTAAGIYLHERTNVTIQNLNIDDHYYSIFLSFSSNNTISRCKVTSSAIYLDRSSNNIISRNDIEFFGSYGICCYYQSDNNNICENTMNCGISIGGSNHNSISRNNIAGAGTAILLASPYIDGIKFSSNNIISGNNIENNGIGVQVDSPSNNTIYHNNFINNTRQVYVTPGYTAFWDDGYPSGGNYWSNYTGIDADGDGIGDAPYVIDANNQDRYPLMHPWSLPPVSNINTGLGYATIQEAINAPETLDGHTIFVEAGTYYENVVVNKTVSLIGRDEDSTILNRTAIEPIMIVEANDVKISGFTFEGWAFQNILINATTGVTIVENKIVSDALGIDVENSVNTTIKNNIINGFGLDNIGIMLAYSSGCSIVNNTITNAVYDGIRLWFSSNNLIHQNLIKDNDYGIFFHEANLNTISENTISESGGPGIYFESSSTNEILHNSFMDNYRQSMIYDNSVNAWENGREGNFWSDYNGTDLHRGPCQNETGSDGIGDTPYIIDANNQDNYPLMGAFSSYKTSPENQVDVISNSTVDDFEYFKPAGIIVMHVSNTTNNQTHGFCRVVIPHELILRPYNITVNGNPVDYDTLFENETTSIIYFSYEHSTLEIVIIPEFSSSLILPLFMIAILLAVIVHRKKHARAQ